MKKLIVLLSLQFLFSQVPHKMSFQAYLTDANNMPVAPGSYDMTFRIFDALTEGNMIWEETQTVTLEGSLINIMLGKTVPIVALKSVGYLEIQLKDEVLSPRQELGASMFSIRAETAVRADTADVAVGYAKLDTLAVYAKTGDIAADTDDQTLTLSGDTLYISDGNNVVLSSYKDTFTDTDDQTLTLKNDTLFIADGNSVSLAAYKDNTDTNATKTIGTGAASAALSSSGDYDLVLQTGNSTTGSITITDGANGNIAVTPNGTGEVDISKVDIDGGAIDGTAIGASSASTGAFTTASASTSVKTPLIEYTDGDDAITIADGGAVTTSSTLTANANLSVKNGATSAGKISIYEDSDDGSNSLTLQAGAMSADVTFTLPTADGTSGQVLKTDGSGTLSWTANSGGSVTGLSDADSDTKIQVEEASDEDKIRFDTGGSERMVIDNSGNVGIGITDPATALTVKDYDTSTNTIVDILELNRGSTGTVGNGIGAGILFRSLATNGGWASTARIAASLEDVSTDTDRGALSFWTFKAGGSGLEERMRINHIGNVGIGTMSPAFSLDVAGDARTTGGLNISGKSTGAGVLKIYEDTDDGTNYAGLKAGTMSADVTWTLPTADGSNGQVLKTDGSGALSWTSVSGGSLTNATTTIGSGSATANLSSNGDYDLVLKTGNSTTGTITIADGSNGNIAVTPNGTGEVDISKVDIDGGAIDGTAIGASSVSTGAFSTLSATGTVTVGAGANEFTISESSDDITLKNTISDKDVIFNVNDGGTATEVMRLDGSEGSVLVASAQKVQFRDTGLMINSSADGQLDIDADTEVEITTTTVDLNGALDVSGTSALAGAVTANAGVVVDNITIDGTEIDLSSGDLTLDVAGDIYLNADGGNILFQDGSADLMEIDANSRISLSNNDSGTSNTIFGKSAGASLDAGSNYNVFVGEGVSDATMDDATYNVGIGHQALSALTTGDGNTASGYQALYLNTTGEYNTAIGHTALYANTTGSGNTASGYWSLYTNTTGTRNTASGYGTLFSNTTGDYNTASGGFALNQNTTGDYNTASGYTALKANTTGTRNIAIGFSAYDAADTENDNLAIGYDALGGAIAGGEKNVAIGNYSLDANTTGDNNVSVGYNSLTANTTGSYNTASGFSSLYSNTTGERNTASGYRSLNANTTGNYNTASGYSSLYSNTTASYNTASGYQSMRFNTTGGSNTASGYASLQANTTGTRNIAIGYRAYDNADEEDDNLAIGYDALGGSVAGGEYNISIGNYSLDANTSGGWNTAVGYDAMTTNIGGDKNTSIGFQSLQANTEGNKNVAVGMYSMYANTTASDNVAVGYESLKVNTTGTSNTALGYASLLANTTGNYNTAVGNSSLSANTTASYNTAIGWQSMLATAGAGTFNTGVGARSLETNTTGDDNTAVGVNSMFSNATGNENTGVGRNSLYATTGSYNTSLGWYSGNEITSGTYNTVIGHNASASGATAVQQIVIGAGATGTGDNEIALGNTSISAIKAQVTSITGYSDKRIKKDIRDTDLGLAFVNELRPVKYRWKNPADYPAPLLEERYKNGQEPRPKNDETMHDGLVAQEVKASLDKMGLEWSGWSKNDSDGKQGIQYGALVVPLIKAVQELSAKIDRLESQLEATGVDVSASQ